jgi:hypothetical protein
LIVAVLVVAIGGVFAGQGLGYIPGSFMTGDVHWFWIGSVMIIVGLGTIAAVLLVRKKAS